MGLHDVARIKKELVMSTCPDRLELIALPNVPLVAAGDDLAWLIADALEGHNTRLNDHDVLVVAQKIVSKAEGRLVDLGTVVPSEEALRRARHTHKDPRLVELILLESVAVVRQTDSLIITENKLGIVMANSGIDQSNVEAGHALLLPEDPDRSAATLRQACGTGSRRPSVLSLQTASVAPGARALSDTRSVWLAFRRWWTCERRGTCSVQSYASRRARWPMSLPRQRPC